MHIVLQCLLWKIEIPHIRYPFPASQRHWLILLVFISISLNNPKWLLVLQLFDFLVLGVIYWLWQWKCRENGLGSATSIIHVGWNSLVEGLADTHRPQALGIIWRGVLGPGMARCTKFVLRGATPPLPMLLSLYGGFGRGNDGALYRWVCYCQWKSTPCGSMPVA